MVSKKREEGSHATGVLGEDLGGRRWFLRINRSGCMLHVLVLVFRKIFRDFGFGGSRRVEKTFRVVGEEYRWWCGLWREN